VFIFGFLFFEESTEEYLGMISTKINNENSENIDVKSSDLLTVVFAEDIVAIEPNDITPVSRQRLVNVFEPLVKFDPDYKIVPCLAYSWGIIDDNTWKFILRPNVFFHDGSTFDAQDVVLSLNRVNSSGGVEIKKIFDNISEITPIDNGTILIKTKIPDPLLLQKLTYLLILPSEKIGNRKIVMGTAAYKFSETDNDGSLILIRNDKYWGARPYFDKVKLMVESDKLKRLNLLLEKKADFLAFLPQDASERVENAKFKIEHVPSFEVQFLLFNLKEGIFSDVNNRKLLKQIIDVDLVIKNFGSMVLKANQFISSGVFGYNPSISGDKLNKTDINNLLDEYGIKGNRIKFYLLKDFDVLGELLKKEFRKAGLLVSIKYLDKDGYLDFVKKDNPDVYFMAFKSDFGDSYDLLQSLVESDGNLNIFDYSNPTVDELIFKSQKEMNISKRQQYLQEIMRIIVDDDVLGIPLFEYETINAFIPQINWKPRLDGLIYFDEINVIKK